MERSNAKPENFKGTLYKRSQGRLLRQQWRPRWFVLDVERNQLTYYNSEEEAQLQGCIDLGDIRGCQQISVPPHGPKGADPRAFFEVRQIVFTCG